MITYKAWMIPGIQPRMVKQMLIRMSALHPRSRKTPSGGRIKAKNILQMSLRGEVSYRYRVFKCDRAGDWILSGLS
jgi:hypothetical protein